MILWANEGCALGRRSRGLLLVILGFFVSSWVGHSTRLHLLKHPDYLKLNIEERSEVDAFVAIEELSTQIFLNLGCQKKFESVFWEEAFKFFMSEQKPSKKFFEKAFVDRVALKFYLEEQGEARALAREKYLNIIAKVKDTLFSLLDKVIYGLPEKYSLSGKELVDEINKNRALGSPEIYQITKQMKLLSYYVGWPGVPNSAELGCDGKGKNLLTKLPPGDPTFSEERRKIKESLEEEDRLKKLKALRERIDQRRKKILEQQEASRLEAEKIKRQHELAEAEKKKLEEKESNLKKVGITDKQRKIFELIQSPERVAKRRGEDIVDGKRWHSSYSDYIKAMLTTDSMSGLMNKKLMSSRLRSICPGFRKMNTEQMKEAYVAIFESMSYHESGHRHRLEYHESSKEEIYGRNGRIMLNSQYDARSNPHRAKAETRSMWHEGFNNYVRIRDSVSEGLLQLSVKEQFAYKCKGFDYFGDLKYGRPSGERFAYDVYTSNKHYLGASGKSTLNPFNNLACGMKIFQHLYSKKARWVGETNSTYWSVLQPSSPKWKKVVSRVKKTYPQCQ